MTTPGQHYVCRRCRTSLDEWHRDGVSTFKHSATVERQFGSMITDHEPEPILAASTPLELVGVCDFCAARNPRWRYPCRSFDSSLDPSIGVGMVDDWCACETCHALIEADDYDALSARSIEHMPNAMPLAMGPLLVQLHQMFRTQRNGPAIDELRGLA